MEAESLNNHRWTQMGTNKFHVITMSWTDSSQFFAQTSCGIKGPWDQTVIDNLPGRGDGCAECVQRVEGTWEEPEEEPKKKPRKARTVKAK